MYLTYGTILSGISRDRYHRGGRGVQFRHKEQTNHKKNFFSLSFQTDFHVKIDRIDMIIITFARTIDHFYIEWCSGQKYEFSFLNYFIKSYGRSFL